MLNGANHVEPGEVARPRSGAVEPACHSISVVIPAYNAERTIGKVLEALRSEQPPPARSSSSTTAP